MREEPGQRGGGRDESIPGTQRLRLRSHAAQRATVRSTLHQRPVNKRDVVTAMPG
jgi:hypothetical protein